MRDILPPESARWRRFVEVFAERRRAPPATARSSRRCSRTSACSHRVGEATDVVTKEMYELHRQGRPPRRAAPRADGQRVPGVRPAPPDDAVEGVVRRARTSATRSRSAAATASSTRSASRCSASTTRTLDVEVIALGWRFFERARPAPGDPARQLARRAGRPGPLRRGAARATSRPTSTRSPTRAGRRSPATRCACSTPSGPRTPPLIAAAPHDRRLLRATTPAAHFDAVRAGLDALGIPFTVDPRLVRGLDYYLPHDVRVRRRHARQRPERARRRRPLRRPRRGARRPADARRRLRPRPRPHAAGLRRRGRVRRAGERPVDVFVVDTTGGARGARRSPTSCAGPGITPTAPTTAAA